MQVGSCSKLVFTGSLATVATGLQVDESLRVAHAADLLGGPNGLRELRVQLEEEVEGGHVDATLVEQGLAMRSLGTHKDGHDEGGGLEVGTD